MISIPYSYLYDGNGNLKSDGTWTYVYDTENHLLSANKTGVSASYVYDGLQRQIQKTVSAVSTRYYYGGWQRLADYSGTTLQNRYVFGDDDEPLVVISSANVLTYLHADRLGSINATTNSAGALVNNYAYGPYGESAPLSGTSFGYSAQRYDSETGLYYFKRRYYSPALGRFLQTDPTLKDENFSFNLYRYVNNDPLNITDPFGEEGIVAVPVALYILALLILIAYLDFLEKLKKCNCKIPTIEIPTIDIPVIPGFGFNMAKKYKGKSKYGRATKEDMKKDPYATDNERRLRALVQNAIKNGATEAQIEQIMHDHSPSADLPD